MLITFVYKMMAKLLIKIMNFTVTSSIQFAPLSYFLTDPSVYQLFPSDMFMRFSIHSPSSFYCFSNPRLSFYCFYFEGEGSNSMLILILFRLLLCFSRAFVIVFVAVMLKVPSMSSIFVTAKVQAVFLH